MKFHTTASGAKLVTLIPGDGIGPEVVASAQHLVEASGAKVEWEERRAGASVFIEGLASGVPDDTIESIHKTRVVLKGPLETPVGFGEKSANVTLRKLFETYGNIRPARELAGHRRRPTPAAASTSSSSARTSRISTPASSTCRRPASPRA